MWLGGYDVPKARTQSAKKNDQLAELIVRMRSDSEFFNNVSKLASLPPAEYASITQLLAALGSR
jgi:hypothetical protein